MNIDPSFIAFAIMVLSIVLGLVVLFAVLELFTISKTLKDIRDTLRGEGPSNSRDPKSLSILG